MIRSNTILKIKSIFGQMLAKELTMADESFDLSLDAKNKLLQHKKLIKQIQLQKKSRQFNGNNGT